ncbi:MAG: 2-dehydropantoate 2-reductase [Anaerolineae bacterium]|nr:2-dehydropantoate 2-reductase [Anaerolineae bacterium]
MNASATQAILIEGVGGVGGVIAAELIRMGLQPVLITANPTITAAIRHDGLRLHTPETSVTVEAEVYTSLAELPPGRCFDAAYLVMKANGVVEAARATLPYLRPEGYVVSFQNGLVEDAIAAVIDPQRILSVSVAFGSNMESPGVYRRTTSRNRLYIGELDGRLTPRLHQLARTLEAVVPVTETDNITGILWGKLMWNCAVSGLCALAGWTLGELVATEAGRTLFLRIYTEVIDTAHASGIQMEVAVVDYHQFYLPDEVDAAGLAERQQKVADLAIPYSEVKPSSLQSLERGRPTETAFLNGYVVERARAAGVDVPVNAAITRMIGEIEAGTRRIQPANLDELLAISQRAQSE